MSKRHHPGARNCKQILPADRLIHGCRHTFGFPTFLHVLHRMNEPACLPALAGAGLGELEARLWTRAQLRSLVGKGAVCPHLAFARPPELAHARELHGFLLLGFGHVVVRQLQGRGRLLSGYRTTKVVAQMAAVPRNKPERSSNRTCAYISNIAASRQILTHVCFLLRCCVFWLGSLCMPNRNQAPSHWCKDDRPDSCQGDA